VIARCRQEQYYISFDHCDPQHAQAQVEGLATQLGPDGILLIPPLSSSLAVLALLRRLALPVVRIAPADFRDASPCVDMDDTLAARDMTQHLLQLGHRRIAFIEGPAQHPSSAARLAGFRAALRAAGMKPGARAVQQGQFTAESGASAARALLTGAGARPTAIFASNDEMAAGALCVAHELGLRVPEDLSIVGFDDTHIAGMLWPALTTVRQPIHDMGFSATHQLLGLIRSGKATQRTTLSHSIVRRDSAAAPRARPMAERPPPRPPLTV
jgi:LacI family transcriptional regulator